MCDKLDSFREGSVSVCSKQVAEIRSQGDIQIYFVRSKEKAADIASRGSSVEKFNANQLWWHGHTWLVNSETEWPKTTCESDENSEHDFESEVKVQKQFNETGLLQVPQNEESNENETSGACPLWV